MTDVRQIHVDWYSQSPPRFEGGPQLAFQGDHLSNMVIFDNAPTLDNYYLVVEMCLDEFDEELTKLPPVLLEGPYWIIPNYYTHLCQVITYQVCCKTETGDYEHYSAKFKGTILPTINHNGEAINPDSMFDPYMKVLDDKFKKLVAKSGSVVVDAGLNVKGAAADAEATGDAITGTISRITYQEDSGFGRKNLFDITGDINRRRDGTVQTTNKNVKDGNSIVINVSNSNSYGAGQVITVDKTMRYRISFNVDSVGNGQSISAKIYEIATLEEIAGLSVATLGSAAFNANLVAGKNYLLGWYVYKGTSPCEARISQISLYDPSLQSNAELLKVTKTFTDTLKGKSENAAVIHNDSDFGDGGFCVFDTMDYAIRRGYTKDDGVRIFPLPSIVAPVQHDIPKMEILAVIKSYVDRTDVLYGDVDVPASNPKPGGLFAKTVDTDASGNHFMNCNMFAGAVAKGIKYEKSRYVIDHNVDAEYSTYRFMPVSTSPYFSEGWLNTYEIAQYFAEQKQLFYTDADPFTAASRLQFGDLLFVSSDVTPYNDRYLKLSHVVVVLGTIPNTKLVLVAECTSSGTSFFEEPAGHPFINVHTLSASNQVFARPNYNLPYTESAIIAGSSIALKPYMIMGSMINLASDTDASQRGYIFNGSKRSASCREYIPVIPGSKLSYTGPLSDGGNLHIVRAVFYDENLNYTRHVNLVYNGSAAQATVNDTERYVRFMFQVSPSSYADGRAIKLGDVYDFTVTVS